MLRSALLAFTRGRKVPRTGYTILTPKRGPRDFYKGKGAQPTGKHTRKGAALPHFLQTGWSAANMVYGWAVVTRVASLARDAAQTHSNHCWQRDCVSGRLLCCVWQSGGGEIINADADNGRRWVRRAEGEGTGLRRSGPYGLQAQAVRRLPATPEELTGSRPSACARRMRHSSRCVALQLAAMEATADRPQPAQHFLAASV